MQDGKEHGERKGGEGEEGRHGSDTDGDLEAHALESLHLGDDQSTERIVRRDVDPAVGMRVKLSRDAVERFPDLLEESGWTLKEGPGAVLQCTALRICFLKFDHCICV